MPLTRRQKPRTFDEWMGPSGFTTTATQQQVTPLPRPTLYPTAGSPTGIGSIAGYGQQFSKPLMFGWLLGSLLGNPTSFINTLGMFAPPHISGDTIRTITPHYGGSLGGYPRHGSVAPIGGGSLGGHAGIGPPIEPPIDLGPQMPAEDNPFING